MKKLLAIVSLAVLALGAFAQDKPVDIPKKDLPVEAECRVCAANGSPMGLETPAAGVMYKGAAYYFCNGKEVGVFKKNPDLYVPMVLPMPLPDLLLTDTAGKIWDAEAFKGKLVLIDYWATWCKPCHELKPKLDTLRTAYKDKGFELLSVNTDQKKSAFEKFMAKNPWGNPSARDEKGTWEKLKVIGIPALFLVKDGQVVAQFRGAIDIAAVEQAVKANLGG
ncbi:MAG: hypothetical protein QOJ65_1879 [Fimbriimonadaceae bacterium]|jgi:thiol-disulfide isomerase/thioredoxin|nr:hypothetical protein [Fimbriimonadaceae bacterium]